MNESKDIDFNDLSLPYKIKLFSLLQALKASELMISKNLGDQYVRIITVSAIQAGRQADVQTINAVIAAANEKVKKRVDKERQAIYSEEVRRKRRRSRSS